MTRHLILASALSLSLFASGAQACNGCNGGFGYGFGLGFLYDSLDFRVPYFAAHPPVYYSHPVPRTYGHSPFAYPPHFRTPEVVYESKPVEIINPYVPSSSTKPTAEVDQTTSVKQPQPLVITNPFVKPEKVMTASHSL